MLKKTFSHTDGISKETEKVLWENGIDSWDKFLESHHEISFLPESKLNKIKSEILFSKEHLENNNLEYFKKKVHPKDHWRLHNLGKIAFLDIETTGLSRWTDDITIIGIYDGKEQYLFIKDQNL